MIVYRFERNGVGPYTSLPFGNKFFRTRTNTVSYKKQRDKLEQMLKSQPDGARNNWSEAHGNKNYMFGCKNKDQLRAYFCGDFKTLFAQGFRIKRYKVPDEEVLDMGYEVAFPVKYHKLQSVSGVRKVIKKTPRF